VVVLHRALCSSGQLSGLLIISLVLWKQSLGIRRAGFSVAWMSFLFFNFYKYSRLTYVSALMLCSMYVLFDFIVIPKTLCLVFVGKCKCGIWFCRILPHSLVDNTTSVCLFVSDVDRNDRDYSITVDKYRDLLNQASVMPQIDVSAVSDF